MERRDYWIITAFTLTFCVLAINLVEAATPVTIETYPNTPVIVDFVKTVEGGNESVLEHYTGESDVRGLYNTEYSGSESFYINMMSVKDEKFVITPKTFGEFNPGTPLYFIFKPYRAEQVTAADIVGSGVSITAETEPSSDSSDSNDTELIPAAGASEENLTETNTEEVVLEETNKTEESSSILTGLSIAQQKIKFSYILYFVLAIIIIGSVVMLIRKGSFEKKKLLVLTNKDEKGIYPDVDRRRLQEAKKKIKEAEDEIASIIEQRNNENKGSAEKSNQVDINSNLIDDKKEPDTAFELG